MIAFFPHKFLAFAMTIEYGVNNSTIDTHVHQRNTTLESMNATNAILAIIANINDLVKRRKNAAFIVVP